MLYNYHCGLTVPYRRPDPAVPVPRRPCPCMPPTPARSFLKLFMKVQIKVTVLIRTSIICIRNTNGKRSTTITTTTSITEAILRVLWLSWAGVHGDHLRGWHCCGVRRVQEKNTHGPNVPKRCCCHQCCFPLRICVHCVCTVLQQQLHDSRPVVGCCAQERSLTLVGIVHVREICIHAERQPHFHLPMAGVSARPLVKALALPRTLVALPVVTARYSSRLSNEGSANNALGAAGSTRAPPAPCAKRAEGGLSSNRHSSSASRS